MGHFHSARGGQSVNKVKSKLLAQVKRHLGRVPGQPIGSQIKNPLT